MKVLNQRCLKEVIGGTGFQLPPPSQSCAFKPIVLVMVIIIKIKMCLPKQSDWLKCKKLDMYEQGR